MLQANLWKAFAGLKRQELRKIEYIPGKPQGTIFIKRQLM
jgi:hypothetical protein